MTLKNRTRLILERAALRLDSIGQARIVDHRFPLVEHETQASFGIDELVLSTPVFELTPGELAQLFPDLVAAALRSTESILWNEVTTGLLMDEDVVLDGFGELKYDQDRERVSFRAYSVVNNLEPMSLGLDESSIGDAIAFCNREVQEDRFVDAVRTLASERGPAERVSLSYGCVSSLAQRALEEWTPAKPWSPYLACSGYFGWVTAFAYMLRAAGRIAVPNIGTFSVDLEVVDFVAAPELRDQLAANIRVA